jgi:hypothetical protein
MRGLLKPGLPCEVLCLGDEVYDSVLSSARIISIEMRTALVEYTEVNFHSGPYAVNIARQLAYIYHDVCFSTLLLKLAL